MWHLIIKDILMHTYRCLLFVLEHSDELLKVYKSYCWYCLLLQKKFHGTITHFNSVFFTLSYFPHFFLPTIELWMKSRVCCHFPELSHHSKRKLIFLESFFFRLRIFFLSPAIFRIISLKVKCCVVFFLFPCLTYKIFLLLFIIISLILIHYMRRY